MTLDEARKVAKIASYCDGGCSVCLQGLREDLEEAFPEFMWTYTEKDAKGNYGPQISVADRQ